MTTQNTPVFHYTQLAARARTNAMNEVRDFTDAEVDRHQSWLADAQAESLSEVVDALALGRKTNGIKQTLFTLLDFQSEISDDLALLSFLKKDTLSFEESGELTSKTSFDFTKKQVLEFDQYKGDFYNKYTAESDDFDYDVIKMHSDSEYTARRQHKKDGTDIISASHSSLGAAFKWLQAHHTALLSGKNTEEA